MLITIPGASEHWLSKNKVCVECGKYKTNIIKGKKTCKDCFNIKRKNTIKINKKKNK